MTICYQNPERVHLIFLNGLIQILLLLYQALELGQEMGFQAQKEPRKMNLKLMKLQRELGELRKMSLDPAGLICEIP